MKRKLPILNPPEPDVTAPEHEPVPILVLEYLGHDTFRVTALKTDPMNCWIRLNNGAWQIKYAPGGRWTLCSSNDFLREVVEWGDVQTCDGAG